MADTSFPAERTAVLTGAASERGIGRATADRLASQGWCVAILDINETDAAKAAADIGRRHGVRTIGIGTDVSDQASVDAAIGRVEAELPPIVALANIAGISSPTAFMDTTVDEWDKVFAVNMRGVFLVSQRVLGGMIERRLGRIVSISSISAQRGGGTYSKVAYSASKAGITSASPARSPARSANSASLSTPSRPAPSTPTSWAAPSRRSARSRCPRG